MNDIKLLDVLPTLKIDCIYRFSAKLWNFGFNYDVIERTPSKIGFFLSLKYYTEYE